MQSTSTFDISKPLYIDVTGTRRFLQISDSVTGIQRVVILLAREALAVLGQDQVRLIWFDAEQGGYFGSSASDLALPADGFPANDINAIRACFGLKPALPTLARVRNNRLKYFILRWIRERKARAGDEGYFRALNSSIAAWNAAKATIATWPPRRFTPLDKVASPDSVILVPDPTFGTEDRFRKLILLAGDHSDMVAVFHDAIPFKFPDSVKSRSLFVFMDCLSASIARFIAVSKSAAEDLKDILANRNLHTPITVVPLARARLMPGSEMGKTHPDPFVLCVGTLEGRKSNLMLAQAWEVLGAEIPNLPRLVFAGRRGWKNAAFFDFVGSARNADRRIEIVEKPLDAELDEMYRNCLFTAFVSIYEGWGLPIGESIAYGKTGVCSNISSMPEVAEDLMLYADPYDLDSIVDALRRLLTEAGLRESLEEKIKGRTLRTWEDVARDMLAVAYGTDPCITPDQLTGTG